MGTDEHGDTVTSCVVTAGESSASKAPRLTPAQRMARDSLVAACEQSGELSEAGTLRGVHVEDWRELFYSGATADTQDGKKRAFQRARGDLCGAGLAAVETDFYRPTDPALHFRIVQAIRKRAPGQNGTTPGHVPPCPGTQRDNTLEGCPGVPVVPAGEGEEA